MVNHKLILILILLLLTMDLQQLFIVEKSGLQPGQLLMIGDSVRADYEGALNCGIKSILKDKPLKLILPELI